MKQLLSFLTVLFALAGLARAAEPMAPRSEPAFPRSQVEWARSLARPQYKGVDPCARIKGICIEEDHYQPRAGALVRFAIDSSRIPPEFNVALNELGQALQGDLHNAVLVIEGHADSTGDSDYNLALSHRRAAAVRGYLIQRYGIAPERLIDKGYGEEAPIADNATKPGREKNRRVEFRRVGTVKPG